LSSKIIQPILPLISLTILCKGPPLDKMPCLVDAWNFEEHNNLVVFL